jgi:hypothetical protein
MGNEEPQDGEKTVSVPRGRVEALLRQLVQAGSLKGAAMAMGHVLYTLETAAGDITVAVPSDAMLTLIGSEQSN